MKVGDDLHGDIYLTDMFISNMTNGGRQPMNMVHRTIDGKEIWLGDYYAASNPTLLKQKNIKSGKDAINKY